MTKILIADDHKIFRQGLRSLLERLPDVAVLGEASDGLEVVSLAVTLKPEVVILDITMPGRNGTEAARMILEANPLTKIIALSMHSDRRFIINMLLLGAYGYLLKNCAFEELSSALKTVCNGDIYVSPSVAGSVIEDYITLLKAGAINSSALTEKEVDIVRYVANGKSIKQIAYATDLSPKTVSLYRLKIMERLRLESTADLVKFAIKEGIISLEDEKD